ncbi:MAG TPA: GNAT family N-acetyltransferase [Solirubrobacteraceae bacterium]|jgi:ribosomal protein S18 acetylase RimI-like enzyme|nr:GNAT family N-acetyltransferase [Solirubrobacteraceae bacterium]
MSAGPTRRATAADVPTLAAVLARAFLDDPVAIWSCRPDRLRPRMLERFHGTRLRQLLTHDEVWTDAEGRCAALWAPPGQWRESPRQDMEIARCLLHPRLIWRMPLLARGFGGMELAHPREPPHWYLAVLGTDPPAQGQGLGSAALAAVLERCDADGVGAYLESSKERNIAFYARHGFRVTRELQLPRGPTMWAMWREPSR